MQAFSGKPPREKPQNAAAEECFRGLPHRGGRNLISFLLSPDPFVMQQNEAGFFFYRKTCILVKGTPEAPLEFLGLVAPYCAIPRDYLSDTPLSRAMGFWCLKMAANWVRYPLPLF